MASREQGVERRRRRGGERRRQQGEGGGGGVAAVLAAGLAEVDVIAVVSGRAAAVVVVEAARLARHRLETARAHKHQHPVLCKIATSRRVKFVKRANVNRQYACFEYALCANCNCPLLSAGAQGKSSSLLSASKWPVNLICIE